MPSTNKTSFLLLNKWVAEDAPKMADFNSDNQKIDDAVKAHCENANVHLSAAEKTWVSAPTVTGSYAGNGDDNRVITLGYRPSMLMVFAVGYAPQEFDITATFTILRFAVAAGQSASLGLTLTDTGFTVRQHQNDPLPGLSRLNFNESGLTYVYFGIK